MSAEIGTKAAAELHEGDLVKYGSTWAEVVDLQPTRNGVAVLLEGDDQHAILPFGWIVHVKQEGGGS